MNNIPGESAQVQCILCRNLTYTNYLEKHIRYHHMVQDDWVIEAILKIRTPIKQHCSETQTTDQENLSGVRNGLKEKKETLKPPDPSHPCLARRGRPPKLKKVAVPKLKAVIEKNVDSCVTTSIPPTAPTPPVLNNVEDPALGVSSSSSTPTAATKQDNGLAPSFAPPAPAIDINVTPKSSLKLKILKTLNGTMYSEVEENAVSSPCTKGRRETDVSSSTPTLAIDQSLKSSPLPAPIVTCIIGSFDPNPESQNTQPEVKLENAESACPLVLLEEDGLNLALEAKPCELEKDKNKTQTQPSPSEVPDLNETVNTKTPETPSTSNSTPQVQIPSVKPADPRQTIYKFRCSNCSLIDHSKDIIDMHVNNKICLREPSLPIKTKKQILQLQLEPCSLDESQEHYLMTLSNPDRFEWIDVDATLPDGWKYTDKLSSKGECYRMYLSPARQIFTSRDDIAQHLLSTEVKLARITGYSNKETYIYSTTDSNRLKKHVKLNFVPDYHIKEKIRDKNPRNLDRTSFNPVTLTYGAPRNVTAVRPWVLLVDDIQEIVEDFIPVPKPQSREELKLVKPVTSTLKRKRPSNDTENAEPMKKLKKVGVRRTLDNQETPRNIRNVRGGTDTALYVQCCNKTCETWRQVPDFKDPSEVPDYWVCSMNKDVMNRVCGKGGSQFTSGSQVKIKYPRGTLVWAKLKGYPWWPGIIDHSPGCDEFYWIDEKISTVNPTRYNVMFFEKKNQFSSAWIQAENIKQDQDQSPLPNSVLSPEVKEELDEAMARLRESRKFSLDERLSGVTSSRKNLSTRKPINDPNISTVTASRSIPGKISVDKDASTSKKPVDKPITKYAETETVKPEQLFCNCNPAWEKVYNKPPLPSDVLITLAVRNLDPENHSGASFSSIVAFLTLHFPYFNRNIEECKDMVRKAYDINSKEETGKENFRIKNSLIEQLSGRIKTYISKYRVLVQESMMYQEFLDTLVQRFVQQKENIPAKNIRPPYSLKMLISLSMISLYPPISLEQIFLFLTFLFPYLSGTTGKTTFKRDDFLKEINEDPNIEEIVNKKGESFYLLRDGTYPMVLNEVRSFFSLKSNNDRMNKSIYKVEYINLLLPNLPASNLES